MRNNKTFLALSAGLALGTALVSPASAHAVQPEPQDVRPAAACSPSNPGETTLRFGYYGCRMPGTAVADCPWGEAFVIAPSRTIWHAWPNSGGWKRMPNNGRADNTWNCYRNGNGQRQIEVLTRAGNIWYSYFSGGWRGWYLA